MGDVPGAHIRLDVQEVDGGVELIVGDNGQGIPPSVQSRIFERFFPSCSSEPRPNLGLGLAIVKRIMEAHAGRITVESTPGNGASFRAFFPSTC
jgi:signal transduction histidine kinase